LSLIAFQPLDRCRQPDYGFHSVSVVVNLYMSRRRRDQLRRTTDLDFEGQTYTATYTASSHAVSVHSVTGPSGFYREYGRTGVADTVVGDYESTAKELARRILEAAKESGELKGGTD